MTSSETREFGPPFDFADGDVYLCSVDGCYFRAHKAILFMASATIRDIGFDMAAGEDDKRDGLPVHPFVAPGEEQGVIANFLRLLYPLHNPVFANAGDVRVLLELCKKYQAEVVLPRLEELLVGSPVLKADPLGVYALACVYRLEKAARAAAYESLRHPYLLQGPERNDDVAMLSGTDLYRLLEYRRKTADAASAVAYPSNTSVLDAGSARCWWKCRHCSSDAAYGIRAINGQGYHAAIWWTTYMTECQAALQTTPLPETVSKYLLYSAIARAGKCVECVYSVASDMSSFANVFERAVENATSQVRLW
jgi:hypothetical protein